MVVPNKKATKKTTITKEMVKQAELLASKAYSVITISDALGIAYGTCFNNGELSEAIKRGQSKARRTVVDHLLKRSEEDQSSTASIFLAKQLKVFTVPYQTATPKNVVEASDRIKQIYTDTASGLIDEERAKYLIGFLESYIKSVEVGNLESRIAILEQKGK